MKDPLTLNNLKEMKPGIFDQGEVRVGTIRIRNRGNWIWT